MKRGVIILILTMLSFSASARKDVPRITYGAEWSYVATSFSRYHYNFFTSEGYRFNIHANDTRFYNNGEVLLHIGTNLNEYWNVSLYSGVAGLANYHNSVPVSIRFSRHYGDNPLSDRWFTFIDAGSGFTIKLPVQAIASVKLGGGYRMSLTPDSKIDVVAALRSTYTQPQIYHDGELIDRKYTNRNDVYLFSASVGISLTF